MIYKSCKYIQHGIAFRHDAVSICNKLCGTKRYEKFNKYIGLFISTIINLEQARYGYGRKFAQKRIKPTTIKLPSKNGKPDYEFMEKFIKSLPYSASI